MAETLKSISTFNIPGAEKTSTWDSLGEGDATQSEATDVTADFEIYGNNEKTEGEYISPRSVNKESIEQIKNFQDKLAFSGLKKFREQVESKLAA